ncbi:MAG: cyclic nucleotide-binding domain-containing protein [Actinomycetota bacterium]|nr:cyclic nucleotide-binding domain-containing protein [Actinomycetota bacterium]
MSAQRDRSSSISEVLAGLALFADLPGPQLQAAAHTFEEEWFPEGRRVLRQGLSGSNFFVILDGQASVRVDGVDRATLGRGEFFGEVSVLLGEPPTADVVATAPLRCAVLPGPQVRPFLTAFPEVLYRILQAEARRLRDALRWLS